MGYHFWVHSLYNVLAFYLLCCVQYRVIFDGDISIAYYSICVKKDTSLHAWYTTWCGVILILIWYDIMASVVQDCSNFLRASVMELLLSCMKPSICKSEFRFLVGHCYDILWCDVSGKTWHDMTSSWHDITIMEMYLLTLLLARTSMICCMLATNKMVLNDAKFTYIPPQLKPRNLMLTPDVSTLC